MKMRSPKYLSVSSRLVLFLCLLVSRCRGLSRSKRATCDPIYTALATDHSMCLDDAANSTPAPFSAEEAQVLVDQHNAFRAQEGNAAGMMKVVWDADIAAVAQKWAQQCGQAGAHESASNKRSVPSLHGIIIGQNVATLPIPWYSYKDATDLWHGEIKDFKYGTGSINGGVIGHYTQVVLEDVARIGCGRANCSVGNGVSAKVVCNYAGGLMDKLYASEGPYTVKKITATQGFKIQTSSDMQKPFTFCADASCKTKCLARDAAGICDCKGKVCLNGGTLDKATCTCSCPNFMSGDSCETVACGSLTDKSYCTDKTTCQYAFYITNCPDMCTCKLRTPACSKVCQNGGTQNTLSCTCNCPDGWTGDVCEVSAAASTTTTTAPTTTPTTTRKTTATSTTTAPTTTRATTTSTAAPTTTSITKTTTTTAKSTTASVTTTTTTPPTTSTTTTTTTPPTTSTTATTTASTTTTSTTTSTSTTTTTPTTFSTSTTTTPTTFSTSTPTAPTTFSATTITSATTETTTAQPDCYIKVGGTAVYSGTVSITRSNYPCQAWSSQVPNQHNYIDAYFSAASGGVTVNQADSGNYCRDPSGGRVRPEGRLWCYVADPSGPRWDYCDVPECPCEDPPEVPNAEVTVYDDTAVYTCKEGMASTGGYIRVSRCRSSTWSPTNIKCTDVSTCYARQGGTAVYTGTQSTTVNGYTCQSWSSQSPNRHRYFDIFFGIANGNDATPSQIENGNYCRDPSYGRTRPSGRLWCFVGDNASRRWDYCDVPAC